MDRSSLPTRFFTNISGQADRVLLGLVIVAMGYVITESTEMGLGSLQQPGPGAWPAMVAILVGTMALVGMRVGRQAPERIAKDGVIRLGAFVIGMLSFFPLYILSGFLAASSVTVFVIIRFVYREKWTTSLGVAILGTIGVYAVFGIALNVPLQA